MRNRSRPRLSIRRSLANLATVGLAASAAVPPLAGQEPRATIRMRPFPAPIVLDTLAQWREHDAPPHAVLGAALAGFEALDIPVTTLDTTRGVIANLRLIRTRTLGSLRLSQIVNCGSGLTGPNADQRRVTLAVAAFVDPLGPDRSRVGFAVTGSSVDLSGASIDPGACESTGFLEGQLARVVEGRLLAAKPKDPPPGGTR